MNGSKKLLNILQFILYQNLILTPLFSLKIISKFVKINFNISAYVSKNII